jgi:signal transduction histidine kinase
LAKRNGWTRSDAVAHPLGEGTMTDWRKEIATHLANADERDALLAGLFEHVPAMLQVFDASGSPLIANPTLVRIMGRAPPREYNLFKDDILERQGLRDRLYNAYAGETVTMPPTWYDPRELRGMDAQHVEGTQRAGIQVTMFPLRDGDDEVRHVVCVGKVVTSELELEAREERQQLAFGAARMIAFDANLAKRTLEVSDNAKEVLGLREDTPFATIDDLLALVDPEDRAAVDDATSEPPASDPPSDCQFRMQRPSDGRVMWIERRTQFWRDDVSGNLWRRGILIDVTERVERESALRASEEALRRAGDELRQAQKLEAIGRLAGGIAHDFNNMLSVVLCFADVLTDRAHDPESVREAADAIRCSGRQAADLTRQLLAFSRHQVLERQVVDLSETVRSAAKMLERLFDETIDLVVRAPREPMLVHADPGQVAQVVMNLALNARDAMPTGGTLTLETHLSNRTAPRAGNGADGRTLPLVVLSVRDTGVGMDEATKSRIFDPFFTTKEIGRGTGLGLTTVFGIVQQSGGTIDVRSSPGAGTTFDVYFPGAEGLPEVAAEPSRTETFFGSETILLVDDQEAVRTAARASLERYGYKVLVAQSAGDALLVCERHAGSIELLLTDMVMPHMGGLELAERAVSLRPTMRILLMSGYTEHAIPPNGPSSEWGYLQKPLVPETLARRVREALADKRP